MLNKIFLPNYFILGSDVEVAKRLKENIFYKKFRKSKYDKFAKTIFILNELVDEYFVPKLLSYTPELELYLTDCGNLLKISTLPNDWENQLNYIRKVLIRHRFLIRDWGLWDMNPYLINNICLKNDKLYFIDFGDVEYADKDKIDIYFNKKIKSIKLKKKFGCIYLIYHYFRRFLIMIWRKIKKYKLIFLIIIFFLAFY